MDPRATHHRAVEASHAGPCSPWLEVAEGLLSAARRWSRVIGSVAKSYDLRDSELIALWAVAHPADVGRAAGPSQTELARRLVWSSAQISELMERLRRKRLIAACPAASDRRTRRWMLTPRAHVLLNAMIADLDAAFQSAMPDVDPVGALVSHSPSDPAVAQRRWPWEGAA